MTSPAPFVNSRVFRHPPDAVFAAHQDPARLARWWGPAGFRNTFQRFDFHPGGTWVFTMHGPDGVDYENTWTFLEIEPGRKIVARHDVPPYFTLTQTLEPVPEGTKLTWVAQFMSAETAAAVREVVVRSNEENFDRLEEELGG